MTKFVFLAMSLELMQQQVHRVDREGWQCLCEIILESKDLTSVSEVSLNVFDRELCCFVKSPKLKIQIQQL